MATTTKILATASRYGNTNGNAYAYNGRVYAGKVDGGATYRSRLTFPSIRTLAAIGDANIVITKVTLHLRRDDGGACVVTAGSSADSAWGAATDGSGSTNIAAQTAWYAIDITAAAQAILNYPGNWYIHLTGSGTRVRCNGIEEGATPYINVVWEYTANTLTTDVESVPLGDAVAFTIDPQEGDARYALAYEFGDEIGSIADTSSTVITWTTPLEFAAELPNADSGEVKIVMKVYDADGAQVRTEVLYLTVTVPDSMAVTFVDDTFSAEIKTGLVFDGGAVLLAGKSHLEIAPALDINGTYGASIVSLRADVVNESTTQTIEWSSLTETDAGIFTGTAMATAILMSAGSVSVTLTATDSRGREAAITRTYDVYAYSNPIINNFSVERYEPVYDDNEQITGYMPSDIGEYVWVTLDASCTDVVVDGVPRNSIGWKITGKGTDGVETEYIGGGDSTEIDIYEDRTIITAAISAAIGVDYTVEVVDAAGYSASQYDSITPGRANFALAASKHGASFGCLPKGTELKPMLESAYPFYAYGGIHGVTNYSTDEVKTGGTWVDGKPIYRMIVTASGSLATGAVITSQSFAGVDTVISLSGVLVRSDGVRMAIPTFSGENYFVSCEIDASGTMKLYKGTSITTSYIIVVVEYTKTVDEEPGSGEGDETLTEVIRPAAAMTSANSQNCVVTASSENSSSYAAWKAFDKANSNQYGWASKQADSDKWIQIRMDVALKNITVTITNRNSAASIVNGIISGSIQGSTDGSTWTTIATISGRDGATAGASTTHECGNETAYSYVRIKSASSANNSYVAVGEIIIKGYAEGA